MPRRGGGGGAHRFRNYSKKKKTISFLRASLIRLVGEVDDNCFEEYICLSLTTIFILTMMTLLTMMTILSLMIIITMMTLVTMTQRKHRGNMRTAQENNVEILKWLLICSEDLRGFVRKVR